MATIFKTDSLIDPAHQQSRDAPLIHEVLLIWSPDGQPVFQILSTGDILLRGQVIGHDREVAQILSYTWGCFSASAEGGSMPPGDSL